MWHGEVWCGVDQAKKQAPHLKTGSPMRNFSVCFLAHEIMRDDVLFKLFPSCDLCNVRTFTACSMTNEAEMCCNKIISDHSLLTELLVAGYSVLGDVYKM